MLLREITLKHDSVFYFMNCLHSFRTNSELESQNKVFETKDFCNVLMPSEDNKDIRV